MKYVFSLLLLAVQTMLIQAQLLPGFKATGTFDEQQMVIDDQIAAARILINAPLTGFHKGCNLLLVFYALPNGNTIEWTFGKMPDEGDDWHFDIQHVGAQTRFLRTVMKDQTVVVVYLEAKQKSWPAWKAATPDFQMKTKKMIDEVTAMFSEWNPSVVLNGHSGGGRFIFSYIDAAEEIPDNVKRIAFIDSDYGYEDTVYGPKLTRWLKTGKDKHLCTLAFNDSVALYNGKSYVSPTGGTWYRSHMMHRYLSSSFHFKKQDQDSLIRNSAKRGRIEFIFKTNPERKIFHTQQVEYNGFIHSMLSGTMYEQKAYSYFGPRIYTEYISDTSLSVP